MIDLNQVMTFSEAANKWGLANGNTIRKAVERKRFRPDEIRKSGDVWLTTYEAMIRVFGQPRNANEIISYEEISKVISESFYQHLDVEVEMDKIFQKISKAIANKQTITLVKSYQEPDCVMLVIKSTHDLSAYEATMRRYVASMSMGKK